MTISNIIGKAKILQFAKTSELTDKEKIAMLAGYFMGMNANKRNKSKKQKEELQRNGRVAFNSLMFGSFNPVVVWKALEFFDQNICPINNLSLPRSRPASDQK